MKLQGGKGSTSDPAQGLSLAQLDRLEPIAVRRGRNCLKAEVRFYELGEVSLALKDYRPRAWLVRTTLGRWLTRREAAAYRAAEGAGGLPVFIGRLGPLTLALERVPGRQLAEFREGSVPGERFDTLETIVAGLHERGIALADLNHRDVLLGDEGEVWVVDLATAWIAGERSGPLRRRLFDRFRRMDLFALARLRARFTGTSRQEPVAAADAGTVTWHRRARRIKYLWDRLRGAPRLPPVDDHWRFGARYDVGLGRARVVAIWAAIALMLALARPRPLETWIGAGIAAVGEAIRFWAAGHLHKTVKLVTRGPYAHVRNPLYLGRLLIFTGLCLMARLPWGANAGVWAVGVALFFGYYLPRKERVEPQRLALTHGAVYERYHRAVPALLPRLAPYADGAGAGWSWERITRNRELWMLAGLAAATAWLLWRAYST